MIDLAAIKLRHDNALKAYPNPAWQDVHADRGALIMAVEGLEAENNRLRSGMFGAPVRTVVKSNGYVDAKTGEEVFRAPSTKTLTEADHDALPTPPRNPTHE